VFSPSPTSQLAYYHQQQLQHHHHHHRIIIIRVLSPEISSGKFPEIYSNLSGNFRKLSGDFRKFLLKFPEIFTKIQYRPSK